MITKAKEDYYKDKFSQAKNDCKKQWQVLNEITGSRKNVSKLPDAILIDNKKITLSSDPKKYANGFNNYFANVGKNLADALKNKPNQPIRNKYMPHPANHSFFISPVSSNEIVCLIDSLESGKSAGSDNISVKVVKSTKDTLVPILTYLFNLSYSTGTFPNVLKNSVIIPVYKAGCHSDPSNFRPIALLSIFSKLLEKTMKNRLLNFLEKHNMLHENQYGFRGLLVFMLITKFNNHFIVAFYVRRLTTLPYAFTL